MKIEFEREPFVKALEAIAPVTDARSALYSDVLLHVEADNSYLLAQGSAVSVKYPIAVTILEGGAAGIPCKKFVDLMRQLDDDGVRIEAKSHEMMSIITETGKYRMKTCDPEKFVIMVSLPDEWDEIETAELESGLKRVQYAAVKGRIGFQLNLQGIHLHSKDGVMDLVAIDGHQMACLPLDEVNGEFAVTIPHDGISAFLKLAFRGGVTKISIVENSAYLMVGDVLIRSRLLAGQFVDYPSMFAQREKAVCKVTFKKEELGKGVKMAALVNTKSEQGVYFSIDEGKAKLSAQSEAFGESEIEVNCEGDIAKPLELAFRPGYITGLLPHLRTDDVTMEIAGAAAPVFIAGADGFIAGLMPCQTKGEK